MATASETMTLRLETEATRRRRNKYDPPEGMLESTHPQVERRTVKVPVERSRDSKRPKCCAWVRMKIPNAMKIGEPEHRINFDTSFFGRFSAPTVATRLPQSATTNVAQTRGVDNVDSRDDPPRPRRCSSPRNNNVVPTTVNIIGGVVRCGAEFASDTRL